MGFWGNLIVSRCSTLPGVPEEADPDPTWAAPWHGWRLWASPRHEDLVQFVHATGQPLISAKVFDSDGAIIAAHSNPSGWWHSVLQLRSVLGHMHPGPSPFDENGNMMSDQAIAEQAAAHERELAIEEQRVRVTMPIGRDAAAKAISWAGESGLQPAALEQVTAALDAHDTFVEDTFDNLLLVLGLTRALPNHTT